MFDHSAGRNNFNEFSIQNKVLHGAEADFKFKLHHIGQIILETLNESPEHVSQIDADSDERTTFNDMKENSVRCALWLQKQGISQGDIVTICTFNQLNTYIPIFASMYVGSAYSAWNHDITIKSARHLMKLLRPKIIFTCEDAVITLIEAAKLENLNAKFIVLGKYNGVQSLDEVMKLQSAEDVKNFYPKDLEKPRETVAAICLSSGSTGLPKGVMHSYDTILRNTLLFAPLPAHRTALSYSSPYWVTYISLVIQSTLFKGTRIIHRTFDPEETCKVIEKFKVNLIFLSPVMVNYLVKSNVLSRYNLKSLEYIICTGSKVNLNVYVEFKRILNHAFIGQAYGLTETLRCILVQTEKSTSHDSIGFVGPNAKIKIIDLESGDNLGVGLKGELCIKTSNLMLGYYKDLEKTKEVFDEEGWLHTGDIGYYNEDGEIFLVDRIKEVMKFQNHQVSPTEIEEVLITHPGVEEVVVVPIPHDVDGEHPMAFVKKVPGYDVSEDELVRLTTVLGENKKLRGGVKFLEKIPKTATGKSSRAELREMAKTMAVKLR